MKLYKAKNTLSERHVQADRTADAKVPDDLWRTCPKCQRTLFAAQMDEYATCPGCGYGFRISANQRLSWLVDSAVPMDTALQTQDPLNFPGYEGKLKKAQEKSGLNDSVWTGRARIGDVDFNLGSWTRPLLWVPWGRLPAKRLPACLKTPRKTSVRSSSSPPPEGPECKRGLCP